MVDYETLLSATGPGETVRIKAVCTFTRHDPVYKVRFIIRLIITDH